MPWIDTTNYFKIRKQNKRINVNQGGTSSGKTYNIMAILADMSFDYKDNIISITTDTLPNLKRGPIRDLKKFLLDMNWTQLFLENKSDHTFKNLCTGSILEFFSCDEMGALGSRRDFLFVNECNRISYETFSQLEVRTRNKIWVDFNPINNFWVHKELLKRDDVDFLKTNYQGNEALDKNIVKAIEARRGDGTSNWWRVYGLGEVGSLEGNIYEGWTVVEKIPEGFILRRYGVDFGFSNDQTAVIGTYENESGEICLETEVYETNLLTPELISKCGKLPLAYETLFICDNSRPEIIAEMQRNGLRAIGCDKTPGEKMNGKRYNIELVQRRKIYYLAKDRDLEREYLTYGWRKKKGTGELLNEPEDKNDHAMDAIAYAIRDMEKAPINISDIESAGSYDAESEESDWDDDDY